MKLHWIFRRYYSKFVRRFYCGSVELSALFTAAVIVQTQNWGQRALLSSSVVELELLSCRPVMDTESRLRNCHSRQMMSGPSRTVKSEYRIRGALRDIR